MASWLQGVGRRRARINSLREMLELEASASATQQRQQQASSSQFSSTTTLPPPPRPPHHRVVVTGIGMITPAGLSYAETWDAVLSRRSSVVGLRPEHLPEVLSEGLPPTSDLDLPFVTFDADPAR